jgi:phosphoribosylaminoimidazole-succinocarboxamide synthase
MNALFPADLQLTACDLVDALNQEPIVVGRSKRIFGLRDNLCVVELIPSLRSFTFDREEMVDGTDRLRLDFYEMAARQLEVAGVKTAFRMRLSATRYIASLCEPSPFETIVKNVAVGSTLRKYPGLFVEGHRFTPPVVKFDFRTEPEDQPISADYLDAVGWPSERMRRIALETNQVLQKWLSPYMLWDFCLVIGRATDGQLTIVSEISPDCMRLRDEMNRPLDKDLFRLGGSGALIRRIWTNLVSGLQSRTCAR